MNIKFPLSCIYLTRQCPRACEYCRIRESKIDKELTPEQWVEALHILKEAGVEFNLFLGNEPFMLKEGLVHIIENCKDINYGMYSASPEELFNKYADKVIDAGLKNYSIPIDLIGVPTDYTGDIKDKSLQGLENLKYMRDNGVTELYGLMTISKLNYKYVEQIAKIVNDAGAVIGFNVIHWNTDGKFDFFPGKEDMQEYILGPEEKKELSKSFANILKLKQEGKLRIQNNLQWFGDLFLYCDELNWHCTHPQILTVDSDGSFRVCGYRKGEHISKYNIFNFRDDMDGFMRAWIQDKEECPGCFWAYPYLSEQWMDADTAKKFADLTRSFKE
jgi:MoaA/NifB/PqqE/SkfB family radical SAM enzyme